MNKFFINILTIPFILTILLIILRFNFNYLVFHTFAEYFAVFVSLGITLITYYTYSFTKNRYLLFIGLGYFWVAILDILHTQTYPGLPLYDIASSNTTLTLWVLTRTFEASVLLIAPFIRNIKFNIIKVFLFLATIASSIIILAMNSPLELFIQEEGLTPLKVNFEYLIIFILLLTMYINKKYKNEFSKNIIHGVTLSIVLTILSELSFTLYSDLDSVMNLVGHVLKFLSFWVLLQAIIKTSLREPFSLMQKGTSTYNTIPIPSIVVDKYGIIRQVNQAACDFLGKKEKDIITMPNHQLFHPSDLTPKECPICQAIKENNFLKEYELKDKNTNRYIEFSISPIKSSDEDTKGIVQVSIDTTQKRNLQDKIIQQANKLEHQATHDALTLLPNRMLFEDRLQNTIEKAKRNSKEFALFFIDLDQFKEINDSLGHHVGDDVLKIVSQRLKNTIRKEDSLARLGGDEFTIIVDDFNSISSLSTLAQKIIDCTIEPVEIKEHKLYVTSSIGISLYPKDSTDAQNLLKFADAAMYKAKDEGRNNYQFYSDDKTRKAMQRVFMHTKLNEAIKDEDFIVYYQPQVDAKNNNVVGLEALVRWQDKEGNLISPAEFIPLAEETGLIVELDRFVMRTAIKQVMSWREEGLFDGMLSLNLAMKQLEKNDFIPFVKELLKETQYMAKYLEFEITENSLVEKPDEAMEILNKLKKLGIKIVIDDFGTGHLSLAYIKKSPISKIKIYRSFVSSIPHNSDNTSIVKAIIALSNSLNLEVLIEGVETEEQNKFILEHNCNIIQGYFYSKPMSSHDTQEFLERFQK